MHRSTRGNMSETTAEPEWTKQEDDLLLSLLRRSHTVIRSEMRRPWKDIAVDMNAEALRLGLKTRFFHHEKVRSRWWSKFGQFYAVGTPEVEPSQAPDTATDLAPLQDILARVGVGALNGQPLPPPAKRGFELPRLAFPMQDVNPQAGEAPPIQGDVKVPRPKIPAQDMVPDTSRALEHTRQSKVRSEDESTNRSTVRETSGSTSGDTNANGNPNIIPFTDGKGKGVARDLTKSWIF
jgi:hypothetical protein